MAALGFAGLVSGCARHHAGAPVPMIARPAAVVEAIPRPIALPPDGIHGIYLTGWTAGVKRRFDALVGLVDRTELNAMVIDVKDDGKVSFDVGVPLVTKIGANRRMISHIDRLIATLGAHHILPIARIACFRDTPLAKAHPELAVQTAKGKVWFDKTHHAWLNPFDRRCWDYNVDVALSAARHGFKVIQFDYVRFPSEGKVSTLVYRGEPKGKLRRDQIREFLEYARSRIKPEGVWFSADVFGLTSIVKDDMGIGQTRTNVAGEVDLLCPMVYPSHYAHGEYGIKDPNSSPHAIVHKSVADAVKRLQEVRTCRLCPWLQDFSLHGVRYGAKQVKAQLKAIRELGIKDFLLWNPKCRYTEAALARREQPASGKL
jgi:hypothetical protein